MLLHTAHCTVCTVSWSLWTSLSDSCNCFYKVESATVPEIAALSSLCQAYGRPVLRLPRMVFGIFRVANAHLWLLTSVSQEVNPVGCMWGMAERTRMDLERGTLWSRILNLAKQMTTNGIQCSIVILGGIGCLLPISMYPTSFVEDCTLRNALPEQRIRDSSIAVIALVFPLVLDIVTEMINSVISGRKDEKLLMQTKPLLNNMEKLLFLFGTVIVPMNACLLTNSPRWAYTYLCSQQCQFTFTGGAVCISFCRYNPDYWPVRKTYLILTLLSSGTLMGAFSDNYLLTPPPSPVIKYFNTLSYFFILSASILLVYCSLRWLTRFIPKFFKSLPLLISKADPCTKYSKSDVDLQAPLLFPIMYVVTTLVAAGCLVLMETVYNGAQNYDTKALYIHNLAFLAYLLFITYGSMRMMKYEVVQGLVSVELLTF